MGQLEGKTALITGATSGIGRATAQRFVAEGATVFITGRSEETLRATVTDLGPKVRGISGDVSIAADVDRIVECVSEYGQGLDVLFANAGSGAFAMLQDVTAAHLDTIFETNVRGTLLTVQRSLPLLNCDASVILAGSSTARGGSPAFGVYAASKAAILSFARTWASELAERDVRVNAIVPGPVDTAGLRELVPAQAAAGGLLQKLGSERPLKRVGRPEEIANAVLFLASRESSYITGSELYVDGGG